MQAYGVYDPKKSILYPRAKFPRDIRIGQSVEIVLKSGVTQSYRVLEFYDNLVRIDSNHPLASREPETVPLV